MNVQRRNLSKQLFKAWRLLSISTIIVSLFFFSLFFIFFMLGYSLTLSEPDIFVAGFEFFLTVSAAAYFIHSLHWVPKASKYGWFFNGVAQYFDVFTTWLAATYSVGGHELNPIVNLGGGIYSIPNLSFKLIILPLICFWLQFKTSDSRLKRLSGSFMFCIMLAVIISNILPLVI